MTHERNPRFVSFSLTWSPFQILHCMLRIMDGKRINRSFISISYCPPMTVFSLAHPWNVPTPRIMSGFLPRIVSLSEWAVVCSRTNSSALADISDTRLDSLVRSWSSFLRQMSGIVYDRAAARNVTASFPSVLNNTRLSSSIHMRHIHANKSRSIQIGRIECKGKNTGRTTRISFVYQRTAAQPISLPRDREQ
jgi:hypothetical protein